MPTYRGQAAAVDGVPEREGLHRHRFIGVEVPLLPAVTDDPQLRAELEAETDELLRSAAAVHLQVPSSHPPGNQLDVVVTIENLIDAHAFPTGSTFLRQVWLELRVTDDAGVLLYQTGHLDDNDDLRDVWSTGAPHSDPDLIVLSSGLVDARGQPTVFSWLAAEHLSPALSPLHERTDTLFVPVPDDAVGPLRVDATLWFRSYPPFLLDLLGLRDRLDDVAQPREVAAVGAVIELTP